MALQLMMMYGHTKCGYKSFSGSGYIPDKHQLKSGRFIVSVTTAIQYFHWTLWFVMIYHQIKFDSKRTIRSENIIISHISFIKYKLLTLKMAIFPHMTLLATMLHHNSRLGYARLTN